MVEETGKDDGTREWTPPCQRTALVTPMIKKTMMQIMLQTEIPRLLAPQTMYSKQSPTAPPDPTLPYLTFSSVAEHLHNLTPLPSDSLRTRTQTSLSTSLSMLALPLRAVALTKLPSRLLQSGIRQA